MLFQDKRVRSVLDLSSSHVRAGQDLPPGRELRTPGSARRIRSRDPSLQSCRISGNEASEVAFEISDVDCAARERTRNLIRNVSKFVPMYEILKSGISIWHAAQLTATPAPRCLPLSLTHRPPSLPRCTEPSATAWESLRSLIPKPTRARFYPHQARCSSPQAGSG